MNGYQIFHLCSLGVSLYAFWLFSFCTYYTDTITPSPPRRLNYRYVVYVLLFIAAFIPGVNIALVLAGVAIALDSDELFVDSWLFRRPDAGGKEQEENADGEK